MLKKKRFVNNTLISDSTLLECFPVIYKKWWKLSEEERDYLCKLSDFMDAIVKGGGGGVIYRYYNAVKLRIKLIF